MKLSFDHNSRSFPIDLTPSGRSYLVVLGDRSVDVELLRAEEGKLELLVDGERVTAYISTDGAKRWVTVHGRTLVLTRSTGVGRKSAGHDHASALTAPMPGVVRSVNVSEGESVGRGQTLVVLEAMKMEIRIQAKGDGTVRKLSVRQGQTVERGQVLVEIE